MTEGRFHRHCEAAKPPKQSRRAVPHVMGGRPTVLPCPILDCFALAYARARNGGGAFPPSLRGGEAAEAIQASGAACDGREAYGVALPNPGLLRARLRSSPQWRRGVSTVIARRRSRRSNPGERCRM